MASLVAQLSTHAPSVRLAICSIILFHTSERNALERMYSSYSILTRIGCFTHRLSSTLCRYLHLTQNSLHFQSSMQSVPLAVYTLPL
jgi:hypothetical protein